MRVRMMTCLFIKKLTKSDAAASEVSLAELALQKANDYREIIVRDVPECTWTDETITKWVSGYTGGITFATFANTPYGTNIDCAGISAVNAAYWDWDAVTTIINRNVPINLAEYRYDPSWGGTTHAVLVLGYQYIDVETTLMILDAYSTVPVYKTQSAFKIASNVFSSYNGW